MDVVITRCAGLDVHQATVVATVRVPNDQGRSSHRDRNVRDDDAGPAGAARLATGVWGDAVAMESTGVYWKPVYYVLEDTCTLLLINMHALKRVPGRKTDVKDSEWL